MAYILEHCIFLHIPKTGGTWVRRNFDNLNVKYSEVKGIDFEPQFGFNNTHNVPIHLKKFHELPKVCIVRSPLDWYRSYFGYRQKTDWEIKNTWLDKYCISNTFDGFIENVINKCPVGYVSQMYYLFSQWCEFVGFTESLEANFKEFMSKYEGINNFDSINTEKVNQSNSNEYGYSEKQKKKIVMIEREYYNTWGKNDYTM